MPQTQTDAQRSPNRFKLGWSPADDDDLRATRGLAPAPRSVDATGGLADAARLSTRVVRPSPRAGLRAGPSVRDWRCAGPARDLRSAGPAIYHGRVVFGPGCGQTPIGVLLDVPGQPGLPRRPEPLRRAGARGAAGRGQP